MSRLAENLLAKHYSNSRHPYRIFEQTFEALLRPQTVLMDAGCGRTAPVLRKYLGKVGHLIGIEVVDFENVPNGIECHKANLAKLPVADGVVDLIISRSVFEHLVDPDSVYKELARVLRPGGRIVFLTANLWDYGTIVARLVPNRFHAAIVRKVEGREEEDTFPTAYKTNTQRKVQSLSSSVGLEIEKFEYLSQYPNYLMFNGALFFVGMCYEKVIDRFHFLRFLRGWILVTLRKPMSN